MYIYIYIYIYIMYIYIYSYTIQHLSNPITKIHSSWLKLVIKSKHEFGMLQISTMLRL